MTSRFDLFHGDGRHTPERAALLPQPLYLKLRQPGRYLVDEGLRDACNVALLLGQPLLLTGEPGTGKSRFAHALAWEFGLGEPLVYEVKSTSQARDLFYSYDALQRYQDIQSGSRPEEALPTRYLRINALGQAILNSLAPEELPLELRTKAENGSRRRSVLLLDEMDKAPRDAPNDVLTELEDLYFRAARSRHHRGAGREAEPGPCHGKGPEPERGKGWRAQTPAAGVWTRRGGVRVPRSQCPCPPRVLDGQGLAQRSIPAAETRRHRRLEPLQGRAVA